MIERFFLKVGILMFLLVLILLLFIVYRFSCNDRNVDKNIVYVDGVWKNIVLLILIVIYMFIAYKSYYAFRKYEINQESEIVIKIVGQQWNWSVTYMGLDKFDLYDGNVITLPKGKVVKVLVTSKDVIHGLFVPDLGINIECIKGKVNEQKLVFDNIGKYYGECNVLCGALHSKMPIVFNIVTDEVYQNWMYLKCLK
ncbi:MAG: cytochrome c oxidase subunit II [Pseudomonadota bacterium]